MDVKWINPFIVSTRKAFAEMVSTTMTTGTPYVRGVDDRMDRVYPVSASIELRGPVTGMVAISLAEIVCLKSASTLLGKSVEEVDADCRDAVGELANIVVGGAKAQISAERPITVGLPKIVQTDQVTFPRGLPVLVIPFETPIGRLVIQVAMKAVPGAPAAAAAPPKATTPKAAEPKAAEPKAAAPKAATTKAA